MPKVKDEAGILLWQHLKELLPMFGRWEPVKEYAFLKSRKWRFDFALVPCKIAIEIEGGAWVQGGGGHNRGKAFVDDLEKYNHAALMGWRLLRFTPSQVLDGSAIAFIKRVLES